MTALESPPQMDAPGFDVHRSPLPSVATTRRTARALPAALVAGDLLALVVAWALAGTGAAGLVFALAALATLAGGREHRNRLTLSLLNEAATLVQRLGIALIAFSGVAALVSEVSGEVLVQASTSAVLLLVIRAVVYGMVRNARRRGLLVSGAVVLGAGAIGRELYRVLDEHPEYGLCPLGVVDDVDDVDDVPLLGGIHDIAEVLAETRARHVIVAFSPTSEADLVRVLRSAAVFDVALHIVPRFFEVGLAPSGSEVDAVWGIPLYRVRRAALRAWAYRVKRAVDVAVAGTGMLILAPVMAVIAVLVKTSSRGPILFKQRRIGQDGRTIDVLKFRTLRVNDDSDVQWSVSEDDRRTRVGTVLRTLSLDELPQLLNVLRGDMSLVGPRPERPYFVDRFTPLVRGYGDRHRLPVGLTGLAQIHNLRGDTSIEERARFDNYYIEHWSPWLDLSIIVRTFAAVVKFARSDTPTTDRPPRVGRRRGLARVTSIEVRSVEEPATRAM